MQNSSNSPENSTPNNDASIEQARFALGQRKLNYLKSDIAVSIDTGYGAGDSKGGLALERARNLLDQQNTADGEVFAAAQRQIESTLKVDSPWTDNVREVAVQLNREQQKNNGEVPLSFESALSEIKEYQTSAKEAAKKDNDEWLDNEANALGYSLGSARRGGVEGIDGALKYIEGMLGSALNVSDKERDAGSLRALRDALFTEKQKIFQAKEREMIQKKDQAEKQVVVTDARAAVENVFDVTAEISVPKSIEEVSTDESAYNALQEKFNKLSPQEKEFRSRLVQVGNAYGVSSVSELGISRDTLNNIEPTQQAELTTLFTQYNRERTKYVGDAQVAEAKKELSARIEAVLHTPTEKQEGGQVADTSEEASAVAGARTQVEAAFNVNPPTEEITIANTVVEKLEEQTTTHITPVEDVAHQNNNEEVTRLRQEAIQAQRSQQARAFIGQYFSGASAQVMRGIVDKLSAEMKESPVELYERFQSGEITVDRQTDILLGQLNQQGYKPNSPGWGSRNPNSQEGRVVVQSSQALEQILRRMLS